MAASDSSETCGNISLHASCGVTEDDSLSVLGSRLPHAPDRTPAPIVRFPTEVALSGSRASVELHDTVLPGRDSGEFFFAIKHHVARNLIETMSKASKVFALHRRGKKGGLLDQIRKLMTLVCGPWDPVCSGVLERIQDPTEILYKRNSLLMLLATASCVASSWLDSFSRKLERGSRPSGPRLRVWSQAASCNFSPQ
ncbi:hypothetical protein CC78DRAFT_615098 [Lojkania enalia]|uniref:Uncharacterized protein n=1 Tax=Lojkania enalia TaxID=147567 RepID=A0A9P4N4X6_9PLEO|nr:hypothetical protein CC78DRAFT_615098 [Didymosphaeria enalia]